MEARAVIGSSLARLSRLMNHHASLDTLLLPTAERAYHSLLRAYESGRVPYTSLLEAERGLIELRFEHADVLLAVYDQLIALERISGVIVHDQPERREES